MKPMRFIFVVVVILSLVVVSEVRGHASLIMPLSRNSIDILDEQYANDARPHTGWIEPYSCTCTNGTEGFCNNAQSCFWFSQGCTPGCSACDGNGSRVPNFDHCPGKSFNPEKNPDDFICDPKYRTGNQEAQCGSYEDFSKFNPWRAPGKAPVFDACGKAGGIDAEAFNAAAYRTTQFAKQGDLGSIVLGYFPTGTVWKRGQEAKTRWQQTAAHGGGYIFRLCPLAEFSETDGIANEACFQRHPLEFKTPATHTVRFANASKDFTFDGIVIPEGNPGAGWMVMPLPYVTDQACDYVVDGVVGDGPDSHCKWSCPGCNGQPDPVTRKPTYAADSACPTSCARYTGLPSNVTYPDPVSGHDYHSFAIENTVIVPADIPAGDALATQKSPVGAGYAL
eukprot:g5525.t1